jgi:hypothetical protein
LVVKINPAAGCAGKGDIEKRERERCKLREIDRNVSFHLIYYKAQFCGALGRG